jgi:hypothetical protein
MRTWATGKSKTPNVVCQLRVADIGQDRYCTGNEHDE